MVIAAIGLGGFWSLIAPARTVHRVLDQTGIPRSERENSEVDPRKGPAAEVTSGELPRHDAVVALVNERGFACSGVLIHPRGVLTARHCLGAKSVVFGANVKELRAERRVVRALGVPNAAFDLGLLVLKDVAPVEAYPVYIPTAPPESLQVVGFGCTDAECRNGSGRRTYFAAHMRPDEWGCDHEASARTGCIMGHEMVLTRAQAADTCTGDSGGAVLQRTATGWAVIAITSRAVADSVLPCGDGGIYVRLLAHKIWLDRELDRL